MLAAVEPLRTFDTELAKLNVGPVTMPATWPAGIVRLAVTVDVKPAGMVVCQDGISENEVACDVVN